MSQWSSCHIETAVLWQPECFFHQTLLPGLLVYSIFSSSPLLGPDAYKVYSNFLWMHIWMNDPLYEWDSVSSHQMNEVSWAGGTHWCFWSCTCSWNWDGRVKKRLTSWEAICWRQERSCSIILGAEEGRRSSLRVGYESPHVFCMNKGKKQVTG